MTHPIDDGEGIFVGAMLVARNLGYMNQVHSTLNYSRKLAALGRLMAGVAHEVKNPLNAMTIHLELLKGKLAAAGEPVGVGAGASHLVPRASNVDKHVEIIATEIQRLDQVLNGFLKFARPDELKLQPILLPAVISDIVTSITPEADRLRVAVKRDCPPGLPAINADPGMLRQALLNLALNACQAMPDGGTLRIACRAGSRGRVEIDIEDTGIGIAPKTSRRFSTSTSRPRRRGAGSACRWSIGSSSCMMARSRSRAHPGRGTRFRLVFPQA